MNAPQTQTQNIQEHPFFGSYSNFKELAIRMGAPEKYIGSKELKLSQKNKEGHEAVLGLVDKWEAGQHWGIIFGGVGVGKTQAIVDALMRYLYRSNMNVFEVAHMRKFHYVRMQRLRLEVEESIKNGNFLSRVLEPILAAQVFVVDDLSLAMQNDGGVSVRINEIYQSLYDEKKSLVLISNDSCHISDAVRSRFREFGKPIMFEGEDLRLKVNN